MTAEVVGVFFDQETLLNIAEAKLYESLPRGYELISIDRENMEVEVERYDVEEAVANVRVILKGTMVVSPNNKILDKDDSAKYDSSLPTYEEILQKELDKHNIGRIFAKK